MVTTGTGRRGSVQQADNGSWFFIVDTTLPGGPRRQTRRRGFPTRKAAQAALTETLGTLSDHSYVTPSRLTLTDFIENRWLPAVAGELRASTHASYSRNLRLHILPTLGTVPLQAMDASTLTALYQRLATQGRKDHLGGRPLSTTTVRYIHTIVRSALQTAYEWDLTPRNVADKAKPPKPKARGDRHEQINTWPHATLRAFLHQTDGERLHPLWLLLATTGLRRGEAVGLTWQALDLELGTLSVRRSLVDVDCGRPVWSDPKTSRGRRVIALDSSTLDALRQVSTRTEADRKLAGSAYEDHGLVFTHPDGSPLHPDTTSKNFTRRGEQLGLPRIRLHDLRHTWATLALESGIHPKVVQERLGHANVSITLDLYSHVSPAMQSDAAERVAALFLTPPAQPGATAVSTDTGPDLGCPLSTAAKL
jgi:integrase